MNWEALESAYEATRSWALHPVGRPPPGWAQMVRSGLATWMRERQPEVSLAAPEAFLKTPACSPLLIIVAAMIAEVCQ
jgi:hypothetical protein